MTATELNSATSSTAEFLVFRRGKVPKYMQDKKGDEERVPEQMHKALDWPRLTHILASMIPNVPRHFQLRKPSSRGRTSLWISLLKWSLAGC
jgi:hypothetical protein